MDAHVIRFIVWAYLLHGLTMWAYMFWVTVWGGWNLQLNNNPVTLLAIPVAAAVWFALIVFGWLFFAVNILMFQAQSPEFTSYLLAFALPMLVSVPGALALSWLTRDTAAVSQRQVSP